MKNYTQSRTLLSIMSVLSLLLFSLDLCAENTLPDKDKNIMEQAGVPIYPGMKFINGALDGMVGVRFASSDDVEKVRKWYSDKFPDWAVNDQYGTWILYNGKPGAGPREYISKNQVMVVTNENLKEWFGLPADMTTEIVIALPETAN
ncbi:hypothetical protein ACFL3I_11010 [Pseudomonadota bacterium]